MDNTAKVSTKGRVVIPAELRKRHHLKPGGKVQIFEYGELHLGEPGGGRVCS